LATFDVVSKGDARVKGPDAEVKIGTVQFTRPSRGRDPSGGYRRPVAAPSETPPPRRTGRPRRSTSPATDVDPRSEILAAAGRLFAEHGVSGTTMVEIARASGLGQSSLYYYFPNKEHVLEAIVVEANRVPLALVEQVCRDGGSAPVQLYRIIRADVVALSSLPYDLNEIHRLAARDPETFHRYWSEREELVDAVTQVIQRGIDAGELRELHPRLGALTVLSNDEATQNWLRVDGGPTSGDAPATRGRLGGPHAIGAFLADLVVRGLLVDVATLDAVRRAADALDASAVLSP
jgi:TetR/AcrR family transcriptional regulator